MIKEAQIIVEILICIPIGIFISYVLYKIAEYYNG
jgi:hypothetical protein